VVLLNPHRRETPENRKDNEIKKRGRTGIEIFGVFFLLQKYFCGVLNSPYRETPENVLKKNQEKTSRLVGGWVWDLANVKCTAGPLNLKKNSKKGR
jgi:hypothetical protein